MNMVPVRLGVAGLVYGSMSLLMGRRDKDPNRGLWVLPGGGVEPGETLVQALEREVLEETGIQIDVESVNFKKPYVMEVVSENEHRVILVTQAYAKNCFITKNHTNQRTLFEDCGDLYDVRWFTRPEIPYDVSPLVQPILTAHGWVPKDAHKKWDCLKRDWHKDD